MADEAFAVPDVLRSFTGREIDLIHVHSIGVGARGLVGWWNIAVFPSLELPELYHIAIEFSCFIEPLFPLLHSILVARSA